MTGFDLSNLHLLRPEWLWALLALPVLAAFWVVRRRRANVWQGVVDPHLLPHLIEARAGRRLQPGPWLGALGYVLAIVALAGPSWRQVEQPLWRGQVPLMIALDLSSAMSAADPPPSRLAQAQAKLGRLLELRGDGPVGLVVYADDAYTVAPLTEDTANLALFLDALSPGIMPRDGANASQAIRWSTRLMHQAGFERGQVLLLAGQADADAAQAAAEARSNGFETSVLGIGRTGGVAYRTADGDSGVAGFDPARLQAVAAQGGGRYAGLATDEADLRSLGVLSAAPGDAVSGEGEAGRIWQDEGFWLVPPLMLLALFAFRRGAAVAVVVLALGLPVLPAQAADWWRREDQVEHKRMVEAAEAFRQGDYARAASGYARVGSADGHYNRGNALAKAGQFQQAIEAYDRALAIEPGMEDAIANKRAVEAAVKRQQDGEGSGGQGEGKQDGKPSPQSGNGGSNEPSAGTGGDTGDASRQRGGEEPPQGPAPSLDNGDEGPGTESTPDASDGKSPAEQAAADAAQRERMQQALEQARRAGEGEPGGDGTPVAGPDGETPAERERRVANEAWLRRVPDDPGGLLREKFRIEHERRRRQGDWDE
ncbi:VWA domain-containing protein [Marilutibacter aestuarii]|uniref:VWA domain-containing protein n=1 Tax=Marilutibacter aestuarii TaxID=1706195 RepID=A0A507ZZD3_9GAMM|nr:VWA domain-containing protein [Lysobacter aestuarii]TQD41883.1 VWA domain-containing protein [Lysobacter aestuarii]